MYSFHNICRTCSCQGELRSLFVADPLILANMLTEVVDVKVVEGDKFPQNICTFCLEKLKSAYLFKKQCQAIQIKLELYLQSVADTSFNVVYKEEVYNNSGNDSNDVKDPLNAGPSVVEPVTHLKVEETTGNDSNHWDDQDWSAIDEDHRSPTPPIEPEVNIYVPPARQKKTKVPKKRIRNKGLVRKKVECTECHKKVNDLELHMKIHLNILHKCEVCGAEMLRKNYARHLKTHKDDRPVPCTHCSRNFRDNYTLRLHLRTHSGDRPYKCTMCERAFKLRFQLTNHLNKHYAGEIKEPVKKEPPKDIDPDLPLVANVECDDCNEKFTTKLGLIRHKNLTHGVGVVEKKHLCNVCGVLFASKTSLRLHQQHCSVKKEKDKSDDKSDETEFVCEVCEKKCNSKKALAFHRSVHRKKTHLCIECGKLFSSKLTLKGHLLIHSGGKPYACNLCEKTFRHKQHLYTHRRTHTGEKPFRCTECDKCYTESGSLKVHMRTHTGEIPYTCSYCNKGYYDLSNYKRHVASHKSKEGLITGPRKQPPTNVPFNLTNLTFQPPITNSLGFNL